MTLEYQAILVALALAVYLMVRNRRAILPFAVGALAPAVALGAYHTALFGRPWTLPYANIENPVFAQTAHKAGFDGLSLPHLEAFPAFLISPAYGLFAFSPVLLLGLGGAIFLVARGPRREAVLTLAIAGSMFLFIAGMSNWRAGWCVGPRYIATVAPFLLLPLVQLWPRLPGTPRPRRRSSGSPFRRCSSTWCRGPSTRTIPSSSTTRSSIWRSPWSAPGFTPYGLGWSLGLRGIWAMAPLALVVLGALALVAAGGDPRPRRAAAHLALALGIAGLFLLPLSAYGRAPRVAETHATAIVRAMWDPPRGAPIPESRR